MPRIYVASLTDYNNGILHGTWIDATEDPGTMQEEINAMLAASPAAQKYPGTVAEEFAIHDHDDFGGIPINEYDSLELVHKLATLLDEHGEAFAIWYQNEGDQYDMDSLDEGFTEAYAGVFRGPEEWAEDFLESTGALAEVPDCLRNYIDFEAFARDAHMYFIRQGGECFAFRNY